MSNLHGLRRWAMALGVLLAVSPSAASEAARVLPMATGSVEGSYFPAAVALCRVVNETRRDHGLRCAATASQASVQNIGLLRDGEVDLALVQSDVQSAAWRGVDAFAGDGAFERLRAVAALFPEPLTLVVRPGADIGGLEDLLGKRVSVGNPGSGQRGLVAALMARLGWRDSAFGALLELDPGAAVVALCEGRIDAFFYAVGHPALAVREATAGCGAGIAPVTGPAVDALVAANPFYFPTEIPAGMYPGVDAAVPTFGVGATLVTRDDVPEGDVEIVTGAILDNLGPLAGFDETLAALDPAAMPRRGLTAPLHAGAQAAFAVRGLLP